MTSRDSDSAAGERQRLVPFIVTETDPRPRDQRDLMERPFFSLAKSKRIAPILYQAGEVRVEVHAVAEYGMATIWDADILIWAASQIVEAENAGLRTSRFLRFTPYQLLTAIRRETGRSDYRLLKAALSRLQATVVHTNIRNGEHWRRHQFSWVNEWEECVTFAGRVEGMEIVLPDWFYRGVVDRSLVLGIDRAYFGLKGGIERWLYRVARKHAGHQAQGWSFELRHLHQKSGSLARASDFAFDIRRIVQRQSLPGYRLLLGRIGRRELLRILPHDLSPDSVDNSMHGHGLSGASGIGRSGATPSGYRAQGDQLSLWPDSGIPDRNWDSKRTLTLVGDRGGDGDPSAAQGPSAAAAKRGAVHPDASAIAVDRRGDRSCTTPSRRCPDPLQVHRERGS